ncbi:hypothetical protein U1Q18_047998 [Sarracenia purpurea var. burkii]
MAAAGAGVFSACFLPLRRSGLRGTTDGISESRPKVSISASATVRQSIPATEQKSTISGSVNGRLEQKSEGQQVAKQYNDSVAESKVESLTLKDYFEQSKDMIKSNDGGPPRWFSPLECGSRSKNSPLLLFLPGVDGVGLELTLHHQRLGEIFDMWCLHIPIMDRTPFTELVKLIELTVRAENNGSPNRPIYLVEESLGGCLALAVAVRNPDIDLMLILSNPGEKFVSCISPS